MKLSSLIKQYREENKLSQREFAKLCGLSNSLISILEMGVNPQTGKEMEPDMRTYRRIADGMGISEEALFDRMKSDVHGAVCASSADHDILEALHQDPRLGILMDRAIRMSDGDRETMLAVSASILKERDGDE
jgi:transcriptional regulator with XRE-family HTH domain